MPNHIRRVSTLVLLSCISITGCTSSTDQTQPAAQQVKQKAPESQTYKARSMGGARLFPSVAKAKEASHWGTDRSSHMKYLLGLPKIEGDESLTARNEEEDGFVYVTKADGTGGYIDKAFVAPALLNPPTPDGKQTISKDINEFTVRVFFSNDPALPPPINMAKALRMHIWEYRFTRVERLSEIGKTKAESNCKYVVVYNKIKNIGNHTEFILEGFALRDNAGEIYPCDPKATEALKGSKKMDSWEVPSGRTITSLEVFRDVPDRVANKDLKLVICDQYSEGQVWPVQVILDGNK